MKKKNLKILKITILFSKNHSYMYVYIYTCNMYILILIQALSSVKWREKIVNVMDFTAKMQHHGTYIRW